MYKTSPKDLAKRDHAAGVTDVARETLLYLKHNKPEGLVWSEITASGLLMEQNGGIRSPTWSTNTTEIQGSTRRVYRGQSGTYTGGRLLR